MTLLNPLAWYFLALLPLLVALYLFRPRRVAVRVSTLQFWNRAAGVSAHQSWFQKLRRLWSLLASLILFALLLLALGRFNFQLGADRAVDSVILAVDTTWSMAAAPAEGEQPQVLEEARQRAHTILNRMPRGARAALIGVSERPEVLCGFTPQLSQVREALAGQLRATGRGDDLAASLRLARLMSRELGAEGDARVRVYLLTDRQPGEEKLAALAGESLEIEVIHIAPRPGNVAITEFAAQPQPNDGQNVQAWYHVQNFGPNPARGEARLLLDGRVLEALPLELAPGGEVAGEIAFLRPPEALNYRGHLELRLSLEPGVADSQPLDNVAYAVLPAPRPRRVLLVTENNWFLERVLAADSAVAYEQLAPSAFSPEIGDGFDVVVLDRVAPPLGQGTFARIYIGAVPEEARPAAGAEIVQPVVTSQEAVGGFTAALGLEQVLISAAQPLRAGEELPAAWTWQPLLLSVSDPLLLLGEPASTEGNLPRVALLPFDLLRSDLPLRIGFPVLMRDLVAWLSPEAGSAAATGLRLGDAVPAGTGESVPPTAPGILTRAGGGYLAINALDAGESATGAPPAPDSRGGTLGSTPTVPGLSWNLRAPIWVYLALVASALVLGESVYLWRHART